MGLYIRNKKTLEIKKVTTNRIINTISVFLIILTVTLVLSYRYGFKIGKTSRITEEDVVLVYQERENHGFTKRKFLEYLKEINIKFPELVFAQAVKECGFKSPIWKHNRNPFGMKEATRRPNKQNGTQMGHAYYNTWKDAAIDYAMLQSYVGLSKMKTEGEYLIYLKEMNYYDRNHPGNVSYLKDLIYIRNHIEKYIKD